MSDTSELSERELEILQLVATGASNKEIAQQLYISSNTVKVHLRNIFTKIGVASRTEAAMYAVQNGLVGDASGDELQASAAEGSPSTAKKVLPVLGISLLVLALGLLGLFSAYQWGLFEGLAGSEPQPANLPRWEAKKNMPMGRQGLAAVALENNIYVIGGESADGLVSRVDKYDLFSDSWTGVTDKPTPVSEVNGAVIGGKVYVPGGRTAGGGVVDVLEIFDPREDRWEVGASLPMALSAYALVSFEGRLYLFGGWDGKGYRQDVYVYDPGDDRWEQKKPMPTGRALAGAVVAGDRIFVIGGENENGPLAVNEIYTPALEEGNDTSWMVGTNLPKPRSGLGVTSIADIIYVIGGKSDNDLATPSLQYFSQEAQWREFDSPFDKPWSNFGLAAAGSQVYVLGGRLDELIVANNLAYQAIFTVSLPLVR
jgi:DNA-binding CsgD family transcriptional regulator